MGILAATEQPDGWAADPEALLLLTLEVGRDDPRLFDEVLDWLFVNERIVSVRRLRNLAEEPVDRALVDASLDSLARARTGDQAERGGGQRSQAGAEPLFRGLAPPATALDPAFLARGFLKAHTSPTGRSQEPDLLLPINFGFRLRQLLGVGARAEVVRVLLGARSAELSVQRTSESVRYAKRNVQEALTSLAKARVIDARPFGNEQRYEVRAERWAAFLELDSAVPEHREWPALFDGLRRVLRWLTTHEHAGLSEYMLASEARVLMDKLAPQMRFAGVQLSGQGRRGADYWDEFAADVQAVLASCTEAQTSSGPGAR